MFYLASAALAHVPHDKVTGVATPVGEGTWHLILDPTGEAAWMESEDGGTTWAFTGGPQMADRLSPPVVLADGTVVVLGEGRYWYDRGDGWTQVPFAGEADRVVPGDRLRFAGAGGLWEGEVGEEPGLVLSDPVAVVGEGAIVTEAGDIVLLGDLSVIGNATDATAVIGGGGVVYLGDSDGLVRRWAGGEWTDCQELPEAGQEYGDIVAFALDGDRLLAASGVSGPWYSDDGCRAFDDRKAVVVEYGTGNGGAADESESFTALSVVAPGHWVIAGWAGLSLSRDAGATWYEPALVPPEDTRGFAFSGNFPADPRVFVGAYSAGVLQTADGGLSWTAPNHGVAAGNVQFLRTHPDDPARIWAAINHMPWISFDGGSSFAPQDESLGLAERMVVFSPDRWWILGVSVYETLDGGASFAEVGPVVAELAGAIAVGAWSDDDRIVVAGATPPTLISASGDGAYALLYRSEDDESFATAPIAWPSDAPDRALIGDDDGVHIRSFDGALVADVRLPDGEGVARMARLGDDRLIAAARSGLLSLSEDGGESWVSTGLRLPWPVAVLEARPDWHAHPEVFIGSYDGVWILDLAEAPVLRRWIGYQRLDDAGNFLSCDQCPVRVLDETADMDSLQPIEGGTLRGWIRGVGTRVLGRSDGGAAELLIDGETVGMIGEVPADGDLGGVEGLADSWHALEIVGLPGTQVYVDAVEAWSEIEPLDLSIPPAMAVEGEARPLPDTGAPVEAEPAEPEGCGCGHRVGPTPAVLAFGLLPLFRRRPARRG